MSKIVYFLISWTIIAAFIFAVMEETTPAGVQIKPEALFVLKIIYLPLYAIAYSIILPLKFLYKAGLYPSRFIHDCDNCGDEINPVDGPYSYVSGPSYDSKLYYCSKKCSREGEGVLD